MTKGTLGICRIAALLAVSALSTRCSTDKSGLGGPQDDAATAPTAPGDAVARDRPTQTGGAPGPDGASATGGATATGGVPGTGGNSGTGGRAGTGGTTTIGTGGTGTLGTGGGPGTGGTMVGGTGGRMGTGGNATGGNSGLPATGGTIGTGGIAATGGASSLGGTTATGGAIETGGAISTGGTIATGGETGTGGSTGTGGTQGADGGRQCPLPSASSACCYLDEDCGTGEECVGSTCTAQDPAKEGSCKAKADLGQARCWRDSDCPSSRPTCRGARVCGCTALCIMADSPGTCAM